jgi:hypothetical protein
MTQMENEKHHRGRKVFHKGHGEFLCVYCAFFGYFVVPFSINKKIFLIPQPLPTLPERALCFIFTYFCCFRFHESWQ